tara:strand:+ start:535 stop:897 length:363 start_codon:yes stop_codon:yes gene_type:complete
LERQLPDFILVFGIIAVVLTVTALASGLVERSPLSFHLMFLGLGFLLGGRGFDVLEVGPHSPVLEVVATLTLTLVLFLDAVKLQIIAVGGPAAGPLPRLRLDIFLHRRGGAGIHRPRCPS